MRTRFPVLVANGGLPGMEHPAGSSMPCNVCGAHSQNGESPPLLFSDERAISYFTRHGPLRDMIKTIFLLVVADSSS